MKNENGAAQSSMDVTAQGGGGGGYQADYGLTPIQSQVSIRQTHRQTHRETHRETEREIERHRETQGEEGEGEGREREIFSEPELGPIT